MAMWMSSRAGSNSNSPASISRRISVSPATISLAFRRGDDALPGQHPGVGDGAGDILAGQAPVKAQGCGEILHRFVGFALETSAPGFLRHTTFLVRF